ncbi:hypothetical protein ACFQ88_05255 [Paenibacillus sp. NPDC056579]|uniref:hypothetical protein n=1 Tax=unclassified Paenibacillus TaxID=185978 RepID=UPI001EF987A2|nr:hypothetical protein [Paenibacillus sp. H1-7]ULL16404.1 hypothetical protein DVH26_19330 [Paenibacillus sp. H1-7]
MLIGILGFIVLISIPLFIYFLKPKRSFRSRVVLKEKETFTVMGAANKVTSYEITVINDDTEIITLATYNPDLFESLNIGDIGIAVIRGNTLVRFENTKNNR